MPKYVLLENISTRFIFCLGHKVSTQTKHREHSGSVVECLTQYQGAAGLSLTGIAVLCPSARHIYPCLVLVQHRKTRPDITEKLLTTT